MICSIASNWKLPRWTETLRSRHQDNLESVSEERPTPRV